MNSEKYQNCVCINMEMQSYEIQSCGAILLIVYNFDGRNL